MAERAHVTSLEAIEAFRSHLIVYVTKVRAVLEEVSADLRRVHFWIDTEQRLYWEREVRRRAQQLQEAQQALFSARLSTFRETTATDQTLVHRARAALEESEDKLRKIRKWRREFAPATEPLARQMDGLDAFLSQGGARAIASLSETLRLLEDYAETRRSKAPATPASATDPPNKDAAPPSESPHSGTDSSPPLQP